MNEASPRRPAPPMVAFAMMALCSRLLACSAAEQADSADALLFVAVEGEGQVVVLNPNSAEIAQRVSLSRIQGDSVMSYGAHNVQGSPDGRSVWVTAPSAHDGASNGGHAHGDRSDELVRLDVARMAPGGRVELGAVHPAHVVVDHDFAYVTCTATDEVLVVDASSGVVTRRLQLPRGTAPHGLRLTPDGQTLLVAGMGHGTLEVIDLVGAAHETHALPGRALQVAVLPNGAAAFASVYDTKQVVRLDLATAELTVWDLPDEAMGPIQIYPTPDSRSVWVADQGIVDDRPVGTHVFRINARSGTVERAVETGGGPHGIVVGPEGERVFVTLAAEGGVASIDADSGDVIAVTQVGRKPNGISLVLSGGAMP